MRIYEMSTDCLVDFCMLKWYIKAKNERDAWLKGWSLVRKCSIADEGGMDCKRYTGNNRVQLSILYT